MSSERGRDLIKAALTAYRGDDTPDYIVERVLQDEMVQSLLNSEDHHE